MSGFVFKQFTVTQTRTAMKVSTDGILLGAWANLKRAERILDIGTGTGLLALMAKQRSPEANISAIEIDSGACSDARENFANSPWPDISLFQGAVQSFSAVKPFDAIISNPPYFNASLKGDNDARNTARHTDGLSFSDLIAACTRLSHGKTVLNVILPCVEAQQFIAVAEQADWYLTRHCLVRTTEKKQPSRSLLLFSQSKCECETTSLTIHAADGSYSQDYKELCKAYYLKM
ncbi:methyltransferase [uncultured Pseudoalteromonas sp.]|uniref:tRNA1(Val) (adenine(37)-N6)-methyltransferase n=1 Tax=uncultured Pseudoalteromonas sp. TaxID=114053 RepID=UPI0032B21181